MSQPPPNIRLNRSGDLVDGLFFELIVEDDWLLEKEMERSPKGILAALVPSNDELGLRGLSWVRAVVQKVGRIGSKHECPQDAEHETMTWWENCEADVEGDRLAPLTMLDWDATISILLSGELAKDLAKSEFKGYHLETVKLVGSSKAKGLRGARDLQFRGRDCRRPLSVFGHPNQCPWCGQSILFCSKCGFSNIFCPECDKSGWVAARNKKPDDKYLIHDSLDNLLPTIIDGNRWDGSDFIYGGMDRGHYHPIVSKRVVDWLLAKHAAPFFARPVQVATDGMSQELLRKLDEVRRFNPDESRSTLIFRFISRFNSWISNRLEMVSGD